MSQRHIPHHLTAHHQHQYKDHLPLVDRFMDYTDYCILSEHMVTTRLHRDKDADNGLASVFVVSYRIQTDWDPHS